MKTYAETQKKNPFDWFKALSKNCSDMTFKHAESLSGKAGCWITCASGNQCALIPRDEYGEPVDDELRHLGYNFSHHLSNMVDALNSQIFDNSVILANAYRKQAIKTLHKIEKRSAKLIDIELNKSIKTLQSFGYVVKKK